jgi:two-component system sensor histidine kinase DesK
MLTFDSKIESLGSPEKRVWSLVSLLFSLFYFTPHWVMSSLNQLPTLGFSVLVFVGFCACYAGAILSGAKYSALFSSALIALSLVGAWVNPASLVFCGYAAFIFGYYLERRHSVVLILMLLVATGVVASLIENAVSMLVWPSMAGIVGLYVFGSLERRATLDAQQQRRSEQAIEELSALAERERIGRDLHDAVGHSLSAVALKAELAQKLLQRKDSEAAQRELDELASMSRAILSDVRKAVSGMQRRGLVAELHTLATLVKRKGLTVDLLIEATSLELSQLSERQESELIMLAKELTTNIIKHSSASKASFNLRGEANAIELIVKDNGTVCDYDEGNGIRGVRARVDDLGGDVQVKHHKGFTVMVRLPVSKADD